MSWRAIITVLLLIGAVISGWSVWKQRTQDTPLARQATRADYVLEDFELIALNEQGTESFTLRAPRLERDPREKTLDIATPLFLIPPGKDSGGDAWEVRSRNGWVSAKGDEIRLRGDVQGESSGRTSARTTMRTDQLNVYPETKRASSPGRVVLTQPGSILSGRGLQLDLATKQYTFKSEVRHRYVPNAR